MMFARDIGRIEDAAKRMNVSPLGCGALAGTTFPIDRAMTAAELGFDGYCLTASTASPTATSAWSLPPPWRW